MQILNLRFQDFEVSSLSIETLKFLSKGETGQAKGKFGELVGTFFRGPIPSYRVLRQFFELTYGIGQIEGSVPMNKNNYDKSVGFMHGFTKFGIMNDLGYRWSVKHDLSSLPGVGEKTMGALKDMGIKNIDQLKEYLVITYPDKEFVDALSSMKKIDANGKNTAMFTKENVYKIQEIFSNNDSPGIELDDIIEDVEKLKILKKKGIYTIPQLNEAITNDNLFNDEKLGLTEKEAGDILEKVKTYYEKVEK